MAHAQVTNAGYTAFGNTNLFPASGADLQTPVTHWPTAQTRQVSHSIVLTQSEEPLGSGLAPAPPLMESPSDQVVVEAPDMYYGGEMMGEMPLAGDCGYGCPPVWFGQAEIFYMRREGHRNSSLSDAFRTRRFDYEPGIRATIGQRFDCLDGWEATYVGPLKWSRSHSRTGTNLNPLFVPVGVNVSTFTNAVFHAQSYESKLNSGEFLSKQWAWDVFSQSFGFRYLNINEDFAFASVDDIGERGLYTVSTDNHIFGIQYGFDVIYPFRERLTLATKFKVGAYGNVADGQTTLINDGVVEIFNDSQDVQFTFLGEWGLYATYKILPRVTARGGYEFWYLYGVAEAVDQDLRFLASFSGGNLNTDSDSFYHGVTGGVEIVW
jgi:hypothetical protein